MQGYDDIVMLRDIEVESHCEHHMAPFLGKAYVAYMPTGKVVGISKLARVVEIFARRLQTQETLTQQIADAGIAIKVDCDAGMLGLVEPGDSLEDLAAGNAEHFSALAVPGVDGKGLVTAADLHPLRLGDGLFHFPTVRREKIRSDQLRLRQRPRVA